MDLKLKKQRLRKIIERLEEIESSRDIDLILSDRDLKVLEALLLVKPYSKKRSQEDEKNNQSRRLVARA